MTSERFDARFAGSFGQRNAFSYDTAWIWQKSSSGVFALRPIPPHGKLPNFTATVRPTGSSAVLRPPADPGPDHDQLRPRSAAFTKVGALIMGGPRDQGDNFYAQRRHSLCDYLFNGTDSNKDSGAIPAASLRKALRRADQPSQLCLRRPLPARSAVPPNGSSQFARVCWGFFLDFRRSSHLGKEPFFQILFGLDFHQPVQTARELLRRNGATIRAPNTLGDGLYYPSTNSNMKTVNITSTPRDISSAAMRS